MSTIIRNVKAVLLVVFLMVNGLLAQKSEEVYCAYNGFEMTNLEIPLTEVFQGGPGKDGIPSLEIPRFTTAEKVDFIGGEEYVIGVVHNGIAKAYPVRIMNYHEVINDMFGDEQIVVTYSPLTASAVAFSSVVDGEVRTFGVSGLLFNNNLLFYDWETESLWSQLMGQSVSGRSSGRSLYQLPTSQTTWSAWVAAHPDTKVLSPRTGYKREYDTDPYALFGPDTRRLMFPVPYRDKKLPLKERVVGVKLNGEYRAYPLALLPNAGGSVLTDAMAGVDLQIHFDQASRSATVTDNFGNAIPSVSTYWYAWYAFHPETDVYGFLPERYNLAMQFLSGGR